MANRATELGRLLVGDIFHAACPNGASLICLVEVIAADRIQARRVTSQDHWEFDRVTGRTIGLETACIIDSVAPLPRQIHDVMLGLDRKMRLQRDPEKFKLDREEMQALQFTAHYYRANPLEPLTERTA